MSVGTKCVQFVCAVTIVFNVIFLLCGVALITLGNWILVEKSALNVVDLAIGDDNSNMLRNSAILLIAMGCVLLIICVIGIAGAVLMHKVILGIYMAILVIVFCGEVAGAVLAIVFKDWLLDSLKDVLRDSMEKKYYVNETDTCKASDVGALWDYVQVKWDCCGIEKPPRTGYEDLRYAIADICTGLNIANKPMTCCRQFEDLKPFDTTDQLAAKNNFYCPDIKSKGCMTEIVSWVEHYAPLLIGIGLAFAMIQTIGFIFVVCLCVNSRRRVGYKRHRS